MHMQLKIRFFCTVSKASIVYMYVYIYILIYIIICIHTHNDNNDNILYIQCIPTFREGRSDLLRESIPALVLDILHSLAMAIIQCGPTKG